jgi:hypothetical protein
MNKHREIHLTPYGSKNGIREEGNKDPKVLYSRDMTSFYTRDELYKEIFINNNLKLIDYRWSNIYTRNYDNEGIISYIELKSEMRIKNILNLNGKDTLKLKEIIEKRQKTQELINLSRLFKSKNIPPAI